MKCDKNVSTPRAYQVWKGVERCGKLPPTTPSPPKGGGWGVVEVVFFKWGVERCGKMMKFQRTKSMAKKPTRQRKEDRLIHPQSTAADIRCDIALGPLDTASSAMNKKWGIDRLPEIISVESCEKWGKAIAGLNDAIDAQDPDKVKFWVEVSLRGLALMDAEAVSLGRPVSDPDIWEYEYEGTTFGIIADGREWPAAYANRPGIAIHTMREVAIALHAQRNGIVNAAKLAFVGAEVTAIRNEWDPFEETVADGDVLEYD